MSNKEKIEKLGNYVLKNRIGVGNFAEVRSAIHEPTGLEVAIKIVDKTILDQRHFGRLLREVTIMKLLNHPNIIKLYEVIQTKTMLYLVMEKAKGGEIFDYIVSKKRMKEPEAKKKFLQIIDAIKYCHEKRVVHRDIKAENLLLDEDLNIKIADFGFSTKFHPDSKLKTFCGSPQYAAPELFKNLEYNGPEADLWSLGVVLYVLVCGGLPFDGESFLELRKRVLKGTWAVPFFMSPECEDLISKLLQQDPRKRITINKILNHKWMREISANSLFESPTKEKSVLNEKALRTMAGMGMERTQILESLRNDKFDHHSATYLLLVDRLKSLKSEVKKISVASESNITFPTIKSTSTMGVAKGMSSSPQDISISSQSCESQPIFVSNYEKANNIINNNNNNNNNNENEILQLQQRDEEHEYKEEQTMKAKLDSEQEKRKQEALAALVVLPNVRRKNQPPLSNVDIVSLVNEEEKKKRKLSISNDIHRATSSSPSLNSRSNYNDNRMISNGLLNNSAVKRNNNDKNLSPRKSSIPKTYSSSSRRRSTNSESSSHFKMDVGQPPKQQPIHSKLQEVEKQTCQKSNSYEVYLNEVYKDSSNGKDGTTLKTSLIRPSTLENLTHISTDLNSPKRKISDVTITKTLSTSKLNNIGGSAAENIALHLLGDPHKDLLMHFNSISFENNLDKQYDLSKYTGPGSGITNNNNKDSSASSSFNNLNLLGHHNDQLNVNDFPAARRSTIQGVEDEMFIPTMQKSSRFSNINRDSNQSAKPRVVNTGTNLHLVSREGPLVFIRKLLKVFQEQYQDFRHLTPYHFEAKLEEKNLKFEVEVVSIMRLGLCGLFIKRKYGDPWVFKNEVSIFIAKIENVQPQQPHHHIEKEKKSLKTI